MSSLQSHLHVSQMAGGQSAWQHASVSEIMLYFYVFPRVEDRHHDVREVLEM